MLRAERRRVVPFVGAGLSVEAAVGDRLAEQISQLGFA
jgi:NAD-dependent SIR2 family protein deacetylase